MNRNLGDLKEVNSVSELKKQIDALKQEKKGGRTVKDVMEEMEQENKNTPGLGNT